MGARESSEARGIEGCAGCRVRLPPSNPKFDFVKACEDNREMKTFCFWSRAEYPATITDGVNVGFNGKAITRGLNTSVQTTIGERLFKYFRISTEDHTYWCSKCFAVNRPIIAKSVFLELSGKGKIISTDMELVKMGGR